MSHIHSASIKGTMLRLVTTIGFVVLAPILLHLPRLSEFSSVYFPLVSPLSGLLLAGILLLGNRIALAGVAVLFLSERIVTYLPFANALVPVSLACHLVYVFSMAFQAFLGVALLRKFVAIPPKPGASGDILKAMMVAGPLACLAGSLLVFALHTLWLKGSEHSVLETSFYWWLGSSFSVVYILPLVLTILSDADGITTSSRIFIAIPFALLSLVTIGVFYNTYSNETAKNYSYFKRQEEILIRVLDAHVNEHLNTLYALRRFYYASSHVDRAEFRTFVNPVLSKRPGIKAMEWIPRVPHSQKDRFVQEAIKDGFKSFDFTELGPDQSMVSVADRPEYYPVFYMEPYLGNEQFLGFDLISNPQRRSALQAAIDSGQPRATPPIHLVNESGHQFAWLVFLPVYRNPDSVKLISERRTAVFGLILGVFKVGDIVNQARSEHAFKGLELSIVDETAINNNILFQDQPREDEHGKLAEHGDVHSMLDNHQVQWAGNNWTIHVTTRDKEFLHRYSHQQSLMILVAGFLSASLLCILLYVTVSRDAATQIEVERRTHELSETSHALELEIKERQSAEIEARKNATRVNAIMESVADAIITINQYGLIESFNKAAEQIFGYQAEEVLGTNVSCLMPEPHHSNHDNYLYNYMRTGKSSIIGVGRELVGMRKDGTLFHLDLAISDIELDEYRRFVGIIRDINDRKIAEDKLRKYKQALEEAGHAIFITDDTGKIDYVNAAFISQTGYNEEEAVGQYPSILKSGRMTDDYYQEFWQTILAGKTWEREIINRKKDGELYYAQQTVSPILTQQGKADGFIAVQQDISEIKEAQELLKKAKEEAEAANNAKSEFLANMSHEIRTPMNAVLGFSELLSSIVKDKQQSRYLESIQSAGKSLLTLINDILDLSKIEAGKLDLQYESVNLSRVLEEIEQIFSAKTKAKNLAFQLEIDPQIPPNLSLDESRLRQVLLNLVGNAVKFTDEGFIKLRAALERTVDATHVDVTLFVEDSGIGVPESQQQLIFESFKQQEGQSNRIYGGTGLGLAICKRLVTMMGGIIELKSTTNVGSSFQVKLHNIQVMEGNPSQPEDSEFDLGNIRFEAATVLVVDDIQSNRDLLRATLTYTGFDIVEAVNGKEALEKAESAQPDVILMDIRMPVMDGWEAVKHLKANEQTRPIPVIVMTASVMPETLVKIDEKGFDGYLPKPATLKQILKELSRFLDYTTTDTKESSPATGEKPELEINAIQDGPELLSAINSELLPELKELAGVMVMDEIAQYGNKLRDTAAKHQATLLVTLAGDLIDNAGMFDVSGIQETTTAITNAFTNLQTQLSTNHQT